MKKIVYLLLLVIAVGTLFSCKDMDNIYKDYVVPNGLKYPQRPDSLKVFGGFNKLRLTWLRAKDPSITHAMVYWNNYHDSIKVDIAQNQETIVVDINNLNEGTFTFQVKTFDNLGNASIPTEVTGTSYGENYLMGATDRTYSSALRDLNYIGTIEWNKKTSDLVYTDVRYKTGSGETKLVRILPEETSLILPDIKPGELFEYRSVFLPPNGVDSVARGWRSSDKPFLYKYPKTTWTAASRNGNHNWTDGGGGQPIRVLDGNLTTGFHSKVGTPLPQVVVVDMKEQLPVDNVVVYPPEKTSWRYLKDVEIYISANPIVPDAPQPSWGSPVAKAQYAGSATFPLSFQSPQTGQFIAIVFLNSTAAPNSYISFMEFEVFGY